MEEIILQGAGICFYSLLCTRGGRIYLRILPFGQSFGYESQVNPEEAERGSKLQVPLRVTFCVTSLPKGDWGSVGMLCSVPRSSDLPGHASLRVPLCVLKNA